MNRKVKVIIAAAVILVMCILAGGMYLADQKAKQSASQIVMLNDLIKEKDVSIGKLMERTQSRQQDVDSLKKELEDVKTELSNTVIKIQATTQSAGIPVKAPAKK